MAVFDPVHLAKNKVDESTALRRLAQLENRARLILAFETLWPHCVAALSVLGFGLLLILIGGIDLLLPQQRGFVIVTFMGGASALVIRGFFNLRYTREDALERIDDDTALAHRPALSLADYSAAHLDDPLTFTLWRAHRANVTSQAKSLGLRWPHPRVVERDPYALRFAVMVSLVAAMLATGPDGWRRLDTAFIWSSSQEAAMQARLDGWIDPPAYTGLPPILFDLKSEEQSRTLRVPIGSTVVLRRSDDAIALPDVSGGFAVQPSDNANEKRFTLNANTTVAAPNHKIAIETIPDTPPSIALIGTPQKIQSGSVTVGFRIEDDYGIASGTTRILNPRRNERPLIGQHEPLFPPPDQTFMPSGDKRKSDGRVTLDQTESPWAGAMVDVALQVQDDAGQLAITDNFTLRLPARRFTIPLAKALIEERQRLALDPTTLPRVTESIDLLMLAPDVFQTGPSAYLSLREIRSSLDDAETADDLKASVDLMWSIALMIEKGGSDDAEKALTAAQEALREALENGASDDEIKALTERLKEALNAYLKDYAERAMKQMQQADQAPQNDAKGRAIRPEDLQAMLDRMQAMAQNGERDNAMRMLDALSEIMKNLQASRPQLGNPQQGQSQQALEGLDKMLRNQRNLRDETFKDGRSNPEAGQQLGERQQGLRGELDAMREGLKKLDQNGREALGQAGEAMKRAEDALQQGDIPGALREQNKALEGLRSGAQALARQMQKENGSGENADGQNGAPRDRFGQSTGEDPLGRQNGSGPSEGGTLNENGNAQGAGERARNVLNELRKRLGEDDRSKDERDYYRRLIGPN